MGETAAALGAEYEFTFEGQTLKVTEKSVTVEKLFELYLESKAQDRIQLHLERGSLSLPAWEFHQKNWANDLAASTYSYGTPECMKALLSVPGQKEMIYLRLADANPKNRKVDRTFVDRIFKSRDVVREVKDADGNVIRKVHPWDHLCELLGRADRPNADEPAPEQEPAAASPWNFTEVVAMLLGEPFHLSLEQIGRLSRRQIQELYFHARDPKTGAIRTEAKAQVTTPARPAEPMRRWLRLQGLPDYMIEERIRAHLEEQKRRQQTKQGEQQARQHQRARTVARGKRKG